MLQEYNDCAIEYNFLHLVLAFYLILMTTMLSMLLIYTRKQEMSLIVINTRKDCLKVCKTIRENCKQFTAVGFDAEWVSDNSRVALVQICTASRNCGLFRLNKIQGVPDCLREILEDGRIIKLGVGTGNDAQRLYRDYLIEVRGALDLRHLFHTQFGLARLSKNILGINLDKRMQCSDWESDALSDRQIQYAAMDAHVSVEMFKQWIGVNFGYGDFIWDVILERISVYLDKNVVMSKLAAKGNNKTFKTAKKTFCRKGEIYSQCFMRAPDDSLLCTCSKRKAYWYLERNRAELVTEEPLTIRLLFEPKKKPSGKEYRFLTELKQNLCVVCGSTTDLLKYWVIPKTITKYFPTNLKSHCSHDVVVLCLTCHQKADYNRRAFMNILEPKLKHHNPLFGKILVERFTEAGGTFNQLQRKFRQNFVTKMGPEHLPKNWSIEHVN